MTDCQEWTRARTPFGYGVLRWQGRTVLAHRWSWEQANGPIPDSLCVLHHCDNPPCIEPTHLFLGTRGDNQRDAAQKRRLSSGDRHWKRRPEMLHRIGVTLTEDDARAIRASDVPRFLLARQYGVSWTTIWHVQTGRTWKHLAV